MDICLGNVWRIAARRVGIKMALGAAPLDGERDREEYSNKNNVIMEQFFNL